MIATTGPGTHREEKMNTRVSKGEAGSKPGVAPQAAQAVVIRGAVTYDELLREISARNPIIAARQP